jgi:hypothetical protein
MKFRKAKFYDSQYGLSKEEISTLNSFLQSPLSAAEIDDIATRFSGTYSRHPSTWEITIKDLPSSYIDLLAFSNGGGISNGAREIGFFGKKELREYLLEYHFPVWMPFCLPFGLNGGGVFYVFDMREPSVCGEYPIVAASSGALSFDDAVHIASSLDEVFESSINIEEFLYPKS